MAKYLVFSVFDEKVSAFAQPFNCVAKGQAARMFGDSVSDPQAYTSKHPADYRLFHLGYFDDESGKYECLAVPDLVCVGSDFVAPTESRELRSVGRS